MFVRLMCTVLLLLRVVQVSTGCRFVEYPNTAIDSVLAAVVFNVTNLAACVDFLGNQQNAHAVVAFDSIGKHCCSVVDGLNYSLVTRQSWTTFEKKRSNGDNFAQVNSLDSRKLNSSDHVTQGTNETGSIDLEVHLSNDSLSVFVSWQHRSKWPDTIIAYRISYVRLDPVTVKTPDSIVSDQVRHVPFNHSSLSFLSSSFLIGYQYEFYLRVLGNLSESVGAKTRFCIAGPRIPPPTDVMVCALNQSVAMVTWTPPANHSGVRYYQVVYSAVQMRAAQQMIANTMDTNLLVRRLDAGITYRFKVRAVSDAGASSWTNSTVLYFSGVRPATPTILSVNRSYWDAQTLEIRLELPAQSSTIGKLKVFFSGNETAEFPTQWRVWESQTTQIIEIGDLDVDAVYSVRVVSVGRDCLESESSAVSRETVNRVASLRSVFVNSTAVRLSWTGELCTTNTSVRNSSSDQYVVRYEFLWKRGNRLPTVANGNTTFETTVEGDTKVLLIGLEPFSEYMMSVSSPMQSCSMTILVNTDSGSPPRPDAPVRERHFQMRSIFANNSVLLRIRPTSNLNGEVTRYWLIIVPILENGTEYESADSACSRTSKSLQINRSWIDLRRTFIAAWFKADNFSESGLIVDLSELATEERPEKTAPSYKALLKAMVDGSKYSCSLFSDAFDFSDAINLSVSANNSATTTTATTTTTTTTSTTTTTNTTRPMHDSYSSSSSTTDHP